jgi:aldose 1-epimerase
MDEPVTQAVEIGTAAVVVRVAPATGGAITDVVWHGQSVLRATPPAMRSEVRACACYPLLPYSNRIRDAVLHFAGRAHALAHNFGKHPHSIHGVGWQRAWRVARHGADTLALELDHEVVDTSARLAWPWPFAASHRLHVQESHGRTILHATLTIRSTADEAFPFGLGWHPFFPRFDDTRLEFTADAVWRNDPTQLPVAREPTPPEWSFTTARLLGDMVVDNVFVGWRGTARLTQPGLGMALALEADRACDKLVVYSPPGAAFVAVEPVTNETDAFNRAAAGVAGTGMRVLPPGAAFSCTMRLSIAPHE